MKNIVEIVMVIIVFTILELLFYLLIGPENLGFFFMIWAILHFIFLLSNFGSSRRNGSYMGNGSYNSFGDICRYDMYNSAMNDTTFKTEKRENRGYKLRITDPLNVINLLFIAVNVIGFIVYRYK